MWTVGFYDDEFNRNIIKWDDEVGLFGKIMDINNSKKNKFMEPGEFC